MSVAGGRFPRGLWGLLTFVAAERLCAFAISSGVAFARPSVYEVPFGRIALTIAFLPAGVAGVLLGGRWSVLLGSAILSARTLAIFFGAQGQSTTGLLVAGFASGLAYFGALSLISELHAPDDPARDAGFTLLSVATSLGTFGNVIGFAVRRFVGRDIAYLALAILMLLAAWPAFRRRVIAAAPPPPRTNTPRLIGVAMLLVALNLIAAVVHARITTLQARGFAVESPLQLRLIVAMGEGVALALGLAIALAWLQVKNGPPSSAGKIAVAMAVSAVASLLFIVVLAPTANHAIGAVGMLGVAELCFMPIGLSLLSRLAAPRLLPLVFGVWHWLLSGTAFVASLVSKQLAELGPATTAVLLAGASTVAAVVGYVLLRRWGRMPATAPTSVFE